MIEGITWTEDDSIGKQMMRNFIARRGRPFTPRRMCILRQCANCRVIFAPETLSFECQDCANDPNKERWYGR